MKHSTDNSQVDGSQMAQAVIQPSQPFLLKRLWQDRRVRRALLLCAIATVALWVYLGMPMICH